MSASLMRRSRAVGDDLAVAQRQSAGARAPPTAGSWVTTSSAMPFAVQLLDDLA